MEYTKIVDKLPLSTDSLYEMFQLKVFDGTLSTELSGFQKEVEDYVEVVRTCTEENEWLPMQIGSTPKQILYNTKASILIPDLLTFPFAAPKKAASDYAPEFYNFPAKMFEQSLFNAISFPRIEEIYLLNPDYVSKKAANADFIDTIHGMNPTFHPYLAASGIRSSLFGWKATVYNLKTQSFLTGRFRSNLIVMPMLPVAGRDVPTLLQSLRNLNISVNTCGGKFRELKTALNHLDRFLSAGLITETFQINYDKISAALKENGSIPGLSASYRTVCEHGHLAGTIDSLDADSIARPLLEVEHGRADIDPYDAKILTDPNRGHWDLWNDDEADGCPVLDLSSLSFVARSPKADINRNRVVAIDFGTKSTVVVYQDEDSRILPMRVGTGSVSKSVQAMHYENPTVIEFIDLERFRKSYEATKGRPATRWKDVCISHKAVEDLQASCSADYNAFLSELKQWAGDTGIKKAVRMRDRQNRDFLLKQFRELSEGDLDPIELYAYYLGLYINNMRNGIFLTYYLSFPVTYEIAVREKIIQSFERGIKKSFPVAALEDAEIMKQFKIDGSISEPAAYAVCALQEYGFEPEDGQEVFYSVFDFGGGTADFDFGVWRESNSPKYDYTIEHFGAGGDRYLGGENILSELAFHVFRANEAKLREERITFTRPAMCPDFAGSETLISDSRESGVNMRNLTEKLRPIWECTEEEVIDENGNITITLFRNDGTEVQDLLLEADGEVLNDIIYARIEKGVENFFTSLKTAYGNQQLDKIEKIYILLAGNSSKSKYVEEVFSEKILYYTNEVKGRQKDVPMFELLAPLGTDEFRDKKEAINPEEANRPDIRGEFERPTGKTGVAFGLIECRKGGRVEIITNDEADGEIPFKYFIGTRKRRCFKILDGGSTPSKIPGKLDYGRWYEVFESDNYSTEIYYTTNPNAVTNHMPIVDAKKLMLRTDAKDELVLIRAANPHAIEYVSAKSLQDAMDGNYIGEIQQVSLE